jgi:hypothetical protein
LLSFSITRLKYSEILLTTLSSIPPNTNMGCGASNHNSSISNTLISYAQESSSSSETINLDPCCRRRIENSVLVWLDASHNQSELNMFQSICNDIQLFTSVKDCIFLLSKMRKSLSLLLALLVNT